MEYHQEIDNINDFKEEEEQLDEVNEFTNSPLHHINKVIQNDYVVNKPSNEQLVIQSKKEKINETSSKIFFI